MYCRDIFLLQDKLEVLELPFYEQGVCAGFPSPAEDYQEVRLDLNLLLVKNKESTFFIRARGQSMIEAGISDGDLLVVDRSLIARNGSIVIAIIDGLFTVKTLLKTNGEVKLLPANPKYEEIVFKEGQELTIWGVVTSIVKEVI